MIVTEIQTETKTITTEFIEYDGIRFYRDSKGYWLSGKHKRLHIYVWEKYNGDIPKGNHIHHIDFNTDNNEIENLIMLSQYDHLILHGQLASTKANARKNIAKAILKAPEWHKSEMGIKWHKEQYEKTKDSFHKKVIVKCIVCGKENEMSDKGGKNKYCSDKCKEKARLPREKEERKCVICGNNFMTNTFSKASSCSRKCSYQLRKRREIDNESEVN